MRDTKAGSDFERSSGVELVLASSDKPHFDTLEQHPHTIALPGLFPGLRGLVRRVSVALRRYRRRREAGCLRCGETATATCRACSARVCDRCWLPSIETGTAAVLCLDCIAPGQSRVSAARTSPTDAFRCGARALAASFVAASLVLYWRNGWPGVWRLAAALLQPPVLLALVPLAFLIGSVGMRLARAMRAIVSRRSRLSS